jgi:hypothetical protein
LRFSLRAPFASLRCWLRWSGRSIKRPNITAQAGDNRRSPNARAAGFRSVYQKVYQDIFPISGNERLPANFAMERPIDRLGFGIDPHDLVTRFAFRTLEFLGLAVRLVLGHRLRF